LTPLINPNALRSPPDKRQGGLLAASTGLDGVQKRVKGETLVGWWGKAPRSLYLRCK